MKGGFFTSKKFYLLYGSICRQKQKYEEFLRSGKQERVVVLLKFHNAYAEKEALGSTTTLKP